MTSNHKNTFRIKIIAKQWGGDSIYGHPGSKIPKYDPKYWYYANNFPTWTI